MPLAYDEFRQFTLAAVLDYWFKGRESDLAEVLGVNSNLPVGVKDVKIRSIGLLSKNVTGNLCEPLA